MLTVSGELSKVNEPPVGRRGKNWHNAFIMATAQRSQTRRRKKRKQTSTVLRPHLVFQRVQGHVSITLPQLADGDGPLSCRQVGGDVDHGEPEEGQLRHSDLDFECVVPDRVEGVLRAHLGLVLEAVLGDAQHLHLYQGAG